MVANAPIIFKVGLQGVTAQPTMEAELVAAALIMKEGAVLFSNMMLELDFDKCFGSVPLFIDNTLALHITGNRTYIPHAKHIALRYIFCVQKLVEGKVRIYYVESKDQLADLGTKHHRKHRHHDLIKLMSYQGRPSSFCARNTCVLLTIFSVLRSYLQRCTYTALLFLSRY